MENFRDTRINHIWRLPHHLPIPAIPPLINDVPAIVENPDISKVEKQAARMVVIRKRKMKKVFETIQSKLTDGFTWAFINMNLKF